MEKQIYIIKNKGAGLITELIPEELHLIENDIIPTHNNIKGLQGGDGNGNYYHLSEEDFNTISNKSIGIWVFGGIFTQEFNNVFN